MVNIISRMRKLRSVSFSRTAMPIDAFKSLTAVAEGIHSPLDLRAAISLRLRALEDLHTTQKDQHTDGMCIAAKHP